MVYRVTFLYSRSLYVNHHLQRLLVVQKWTCVKAALNKASFSRTPVNKAGLLLTSPSSPTYEYYLSKLYLPDQTHAAGLLSVGTATGPAVAFPQH